MSVNCVCVCLLQDLPHHEGLTQLPHQLSALLRSCWAFEVIGLVLLVRSFARVSSVHTVSVCAAVMCCCIRLDSYFRRAVLLGLPGNCKKKKCLQAYTASRNQKIKIELGAAI